MNRLCILIVLLLTSLVGCRSGPPAGETARLVELRRRARAIVARHSDVPAITVAEVLASPTPCLLVDARPERERRVSMLPGALTPAQLAARLDQHPSAEPAPLVVYYCTVGERSAVAARRHLRQGGQAVNLQGGILAWVAAGQVVHDAAGRPTRRVHTWSRDWALLPDGYEPVWD